MSYIKKYLQHPLTYEMDLDDPETTQLRRHIIQDKPLLKNIYEEWYKAIQADLPEPEGNILEIGTGAGFLKKYIPKLITSDLMPIEGIDLVIDALNLPDFEEQLSAIVFINVLHHITDPKVFLTQARKIIKKNGSIIMIEPWVTPWSKFIYGNFHHEPFFPKSKSWTLPEGGPLSGGNDALPWILFERDWDQFSKIIPWKIKKVKRFMPLKYLLSGGFSTRNLSPKWMVKPIDLFEQSLPDFVIQKTAMFSLIVLE